MSKAMSVVRKIVTRDLVIILPYGLCLILLMGYGIWRQTVCIQNGRWSTVSSEQLMYAALIGIAFFLYLGYELGVRLQETDMIETLQPLPGAALGYMGAAVMWIIIGSVPVLAIMQMFHIGIFVMGQLDWRNIWNISTANLLYFFLTPLTCGCIGLMLSRLLGSKRLAVYPIVLLLVFLSTALWDELLLIMMDTRSQAGVIFYTIKEWFSFTPYGVSSSQYMLDHIYGIPQEAARWILMLLWLAISFLVIFPPLITRRTGKWGLRIVSGMLALVCTGAFISRGPLWTTGSSPISLGGYADVQWQRDHPMTAETGGFTIEHYDMDLTLGMQLTADVTLTLSSLEPEKTDYTMTLHRLLKIISLTDTEGNRIPYNRNGNVFSFAKAALPESGKIRLQYTGALYSYYCNDQALALTAWYPYYPMAGIRPVLRSGSTYGKDNITLPLESAEYTVRVHAPYTVYSNLDGENNCFSGNGRGLTLMGSRLTMEANARGVCCVVGVTENVARFKAMMDELQPIIDTVNRNLGSQLVQHPAMLGKKVFVLPQSVSVGRVNDKYVDCGDHIWLSDDGFISSEAFIMGYLNQFLASDNGCMWLGSVFMDALREKEMDLGISVSSDPEFWLKKLEDFSKADPEAIPQGDTIRLILRNCVDYLQKHEGVQAMAKIYERLQTPADQCETNEFLFIRDMMKEVMGNAAIVESDS